MRATENMFKPPEFIRRKHRPNKTTYQARFTKRGERDEIEFLAQDDERVALQQRDMYNNPYPKPLTLNPEPCTLKPRP